MNEQGGPASVHHRYGEAFEDDELADAAETASILDTAYHGKTRQGELSAPSKNR